jgi:hypothetical protein
MKVTGETFSYQIKKKSRRGMILNISKLSGKRTVAGQNSGELYTKKHRRGNSYFLGIALQSYS